MFTKEKARQTASHRQKCVISPDATDKHGSSNRAFALTGPGGPPHTDYMSELIRICVGVMAVVSLLAIAAYLLTLIAVMAWLWMSLKTSKRDPIDREIEMLLRDFQSPHQPNQGGAIRPPRNVATQSAEWAVRAFHGRF